MIHSAKDTEWIAALRNENPDESTLCRFCHHSRLGHCDLLSGKWNSPDGYEMFASSHILKSEFDRNYEELCREEEERKEIDAEEERLSQIYDKCVTNSELLQAFRENGNPDMVSVCEICICRNRWQGWCDLQSGDFMKPHGCEEFRRRYKENPEPMTTKDARRWYRENFGESTGGSDTLI